MGFMNARIRTLAPLAALATALAAAGAATVAAAEEGGTITGTVTATPQKYLKDTVVYVQKAPGTFQPKTVEMDQVNRAFVPHIVTITVGDTVKFLNHDHLDHNVHSPDGGYNLGVWGYGESRSHTFEKAGAFTQLCSLHPEMLGYVFVGQNPYAAVVNDQGKYTIKGVPPGTYQLAIWNPELKAAPRQVRVATGASQAVDFSLSR